MYHRRVMIMVNVVAMMFDYDGFGLGSGRSEGGDPDESTTEGEEGFHMIKLGFGYGRF